MKLMILGLLLCLNLSQYACAQNNLFDSKNVLGPYPALGSEEEKQDIQQLLYYQQTRTTEQCATAQAEANNGSLETFFGGNHGLLSAAELNKVQSKLKWVTVKTGTKIFYYKTKFDRPRPYVTHPEIKPCVDLENSKSYPSGHTTLARVYGRILAVIFPERAALFMKRADEVALNRLIGGVHHPSDVVAGKKLGDSIANDYLEDGNSFYQLQTLNN
ncbi:MAG: phosphatase PAP2 family protein [Bacteriovorax sp.]|nr:phosphatase PAP2 family protein [Bacteriovorax sp.]